MSKVRITLKKSLIGRKANQIAPANSLGLRKIDDTKEVELNAAVQGKIDVISHLVSVEQEG